MVHKVFIITLFAIDKELTCAQNKHDKMLGFRVHVASYGSCLMHWITSDFFVVCMHMNVV